MGIGVDLPAETKLVEQERAYTSRIWYSLTVNRNSGQEHSVADKSNRGQMAELKVALHPTSWGISPANSDGLVAS